MKPSGKKWRKIRRKMLAAQITSSDWMAALRSNAWLKFGLVLSVLGVVINAYGLLHMEPYSFLVGFFATFVGGSVLAATVCGTETTRAYRRAKNQMMDGTFDKRLQELYADKMYCVRVGAVRAACDLGLEGQLLPRLRDNWRPWGRLKANGWKFLFG